MKSQVQHQFPSHHLQLQLQVSRNKHESESDLDFELFRDSSSYHLSNQRLAYYYMGLISTQLIFYWIDTPSVGGEREAIVRFVSLRFPSDQN